MPPRRDDGVYPINAKEKPQRFAGVGAGFSFQQHFNSRYKMAGNDGKGKTLVLTRVHGRTVRASGFNRFDGTQANDARTTQFLAALASAAGDHTSDKLARRMIQNAVAELFDASHRLERLEACGRVLPAVREAVS